MSARFILHVIAAIGWLIAAVFAYAFIVLFGYLGVAFYGLLILFICMQVELEPDEVSRPRRWLSFRLLRILGLGLSAMGAAGFLFIQIGLTF